MENKRNSEEKVTIRKIILESSYEEEKHEDYWSNVPRRCTPYFAENGETIYFPKK